MNLFSAWRYVRLVDELRRGQLVRRYVSGQGVIVALFLGLLGIAMTIYLTFAPDLPSAVLHGNA